jgi:hypothetical protein
MSYEIAKKINGKRANEIIEIIGADTSAIRGSSRKDKVRAILRKMEEVFSENQWNIRDISLSNKVGGWIFKYIIFGNGAGLVNLCKLKMMTHTGNPIYSIDGEEE